MKISKKTFTLISVGCVLMCVLIGTAAYKVNNNPKLIEDELPIQRIHGSFIYDVNNKFETVGIADYVFIGKVIKNDGTKYKNIVTMEDENGNTKDVGTPYTDFTVQVIDNIKGSLKTDSYIKITKYGGINQDKTEIYLFDDDILPTEDNNYVFLAYGQPDGSLLISGPNSNVPINTTYNDASVIKRNSVVENYMDAYEREIIPAERERFVSMYEE